VKFIFGLGNPGRRYKNNRHNIGYQVVEKIAEKDSSSFKRSFKLKAYLAATDSYCLIKPASFMNNSGQAVRAAHKKYQFSLEDLLVVYDDADLELGAIKFRKSGSSGGHRGMQSVIESLETDQICRLKIGIGRDLGVDTVNYVLSDFSRSESEALEEVISKAASACQDWVLDGPDFVMQKYNRKLTR